MVFTSKDKRYAYSKPRHDMKNVPCDIPICPVIKVFTVRVSGFWFEFRVEFMV